MNSVLTIQEPLGETTHLSHGDIEQRKTELLSALYCSKEQGEGSHTSTGVPENWLPPEESLIPNLLRLVVY